MESQNYREVWFGVKMVKPNHIWVPPNTYLRLINGGEKMEKNPMKKGPKRSQAMNGRVAKFKPPSDKKPDCREALWLVLRLPWLALQCTDNTGQLVSWA